MSIRPLALLDLPYIYSFRDDAVGLDTARRLTRGNPLGAVGLLSYMNPARHIYGAIANGENESVLGGIFHSPDETFAKLIYLAPASQLGHPDLPELIENLSAQAGAWGAFHVLAEVDETSDAFVSLRRAICEWLDVQRRREVLRERITWRVWDGIVTVDPPRSDKRERKTCIAHRQFTGPPQPACLRVRTFLSSLA
jgi:hypothetical protein